MYSKSSEQVQYMGINSNLLPKSQVDQHCHHSESTFNFILLKSTSQ